MEKMQKVRIIKKNDADSLEYEVGDILSVEGTWYGGVNAKGRSGIPLSLDGRNTKNTGRSRRMRPDRRNGRERRAGKTEGSIPFPISSASWTASVKWSPPA